MALKSARKGRRERKWVYSLECATQSCRELRRKAAGRVDLRCLLAHLFGRTWSECRLSKSAELPASARNAACERPKPSLLLTMLDAFEIITTSGVVLWSKSYAPVGAHVVNSLINDVFIEEKVRPQDAPDGVSPVYRKDKYTLKWRRVKEFGLIFVVRLENSLI